MILASLRLRSRPGGTTDNSPAFQRRERREESLMLNTFSIMGILASKSVGTDAPFNRKPGDKPALNKTEIAEIIAFLRTLNDGYAQAKR